MRTIVCIRNRPGDLPGTISIGRPGCIDPKTDRAFVDETGPWEVWQTSAATCPACGELLGTSRRRYGRNRWPATVTAVTCANCGVQLCDRCSFLVKTDEITGSYFHRPSSGGRGWRKPIYRYEHLCRTCHDARPLTPRAPDPGRALLHKLGLLIE